MQDLELEQSNGRLSTVVGDVVSLDTIQKIMEAAGERVDALANAAVPRGGATKIEATWTSEFAEERLSPARQVTRNEHGNP